MPEDSPTPVNPPTTLPDVLSDIPVRKAFLMIVKQMIGLVLVGGAIEMLQLLTSNINSQYLNSSISWLLELFEGGRSFLLWALVIVSCFLMAASAVRFYRACRNLGLPFLTAIGLIFSHPTASRVPPEFRFPAMQLKQPTLNDWEAMLGEVDKSFSEPWWDHYRALVEKRRTNTLASDELRELMALTDTLEEVNVRRIAFFQSASKRLGMSLKELMERFNLKPRVV